MDSSWLIYNQTSQKENKENFLCNTSITATTTTLNNISLNSFGILNTLNSNLNANSSFTNASGAANINDSFDCDKIKLDVYEKSIQKLANENKLLRKRVKKLTELARSKEEQLLDAFNEACEDKRKNEEKSQIEHNAQLQSYYECFLQIEKENDSLKVKIENMRSNMHLQQEKIENLAKELEKYRKEEGNLENQMDTNTQTEMDEVNVQETKAKDELNKISMQHIEEEITELNKTVKQFMQDKQALKQEEPEEEQGNYKTQRINELELELETLNKKLASIEASLARWIFRACDYKSDLTKLNEKLSNYEQLTLDLEQTQAKLNCLLQKRVSNSQTQTLAIESKESSVQTNLIEKINSSSQTESKQPGLVAQQAAKLNQIALENQNSLKHKQPSVNVNELASLKLKVDNLVLEKNSFKVKNDELLRELNEATLKLELLNKPIGNCVTTPKQIEQVLAESRSIQTNPIQIESKECQTNKEDSGLEQLKIEFDSLKLKLDKKLRELDEEKSLNVKLKSQLEEINQKLEENELNLSKQLTEFSLNKKVSDTIIQQQKKLLDYLQSKLNGSLADEEQHHHHIKTLFQKKNKIKQQNPLLANLQKTTNQNLLNKQQELVKQQTKPATSAAATLPVVKGNIKEIEIELNSNYQTYSELNNKQQSDSSTSSKINATKQPKQIHVFITGLNTCPTYCHVCQKLIPLIAYASKCQLCSFTSHSTCSSITKASKSAKSTSKLDSTNNQYDPLKYCNINYLLISLEYNSYINKLINLNLNTVMAKASTTSVLLSDWVYIENSSKWKKLWISLRIDEKQQEAKLDIYQTKTNLKPFDTINLIQEKVQIETNIKSINKLTNSSGSNVVIDSLGAESIYEELNEENFDGFPNFEKSSLVILLYGSNRLTLKLAFNSYNKKNIWYDALLSSILIGRSAVSSLTLNSKKMLNQTSTMPQGDQFKLLNLNKVLKPFLELCDTIVNSYCFINDNLIALACDDGLYALNSYNHKSGMSNNISLVKIDKVESAHKLYYENEFGKLCFIGRKSRQFLSIDVNELNTCLINNDYKSNDEDLDEDEEAKSVMVSLEHIHNIDRCHLFECKLNKSNGYWYLAVATPETIFILLFNKISNKYTLVKTIQTQSESPCLCIKFTNNFAINQLVYACGKDFYKMDMTYLQSSTIQAEQVSQQGQPIAVCVLTPSNYCHQEALLLCYETYGLFLVYNFNTGQWQVPVLGHKKSSSSSSISSANGSTQSLNNSSSSNLLQTSCVLKWPRGNGLTPLQIEYDASYLYLFYNDSIVVYQISFESDLSLSVRKCGITFVYKPRYLNSFNNKNSNCIIISNRRPLDEEQLRLESASELDINKELSEYYDYGDDSKSKNDPLLHDLNDKICLSYFSPGSN